MPITPAAGRRGELAAFLAAKRARIQPADAGLPVGPRRRTPGLRREEVAQLSGVGLTWYTWLEQGRDIAVSPQVVSALARALRLDDDERRHLYVLAGLAVPDSGPTAHSASRPRLQRLVDELAPTIACVYDEHFDYVVWNSPYARARHDPAQLPKDRRNLLWAIFTDESLRQMIVGWEAVAHSLMAQFRLAAGQRAGDARFEELAGAMRATSAQFAHWWAQYPVKTFAPATISMRHPKAGLISFVLYQFRLVDNPDLLMVVQLPATDEDRKRLVSVI